MALAPFIFGGNTGIKTPQEAAHLRAVAEALASRGHTPHTIGEGLSAIGDAIASRRYRMRGERMESEGRAAYDAKYGDLVKSLISGGRAAPTVPDAPVAGDVSISSYSPPDDVTGQPDLQTAGISIDAEPGQQPQPQPQPQPQQQPGVQVADSGNGFDPRMFDALNDPWVPEGTKAVLGALLEQQLKARAPRDPIKVGEGDTLIDPVTHQVVYGGQKNGALFTGKSVDAQGLNYLIEQGVISKEQAANVAAGKTITGPNGEIIFMSPQGLSVQQPSGGTVLTGPKMSEDMRKARGYATRATAADKIMSTTNIEAAGKDIKDNLLAGIPLFGNYLVQEDYQQFDQAQRDFVNAILRRESGAAISSSEFQNARQQYFPQPGDGPKVLKQKAANRENAIASLNESGQPVPTFGGEDPAPAPDPSEPEITAEPQPVPAGVSEDDIEYTMKLYGMTREQVLERLNAP